MEKKIQGYLHLYLGCEVDTNIAGQYVHPYGNVSIKELTPENFNLIYDQLDRKERYQKEGFNDLNHLYAKPILRPLSDMTEEESLNIFGKSIMTNIERAEEVRELLRMGFDLFGLIESGLAIQHPPTKKTIKKMAKTKEEMESLVLDALFINVYEYAKKTVIEFDKWRHKNKYVQYVGFDTPSWFKKPPSPGVQTYLSTEQLYTLYLTSK